MMPRALLRMAKWARHPPSAARVRFGLAVIGLCVVLFAIERVFGWPDWLQVDHLRAGAPRR